MSGGRERPDQAAGTIIGAVVMEHNSTPAAHAGAEAMLVVGDAADARQATHGVRAQNSARRRTPLSLDPNIRHWRFPESVSCRWDVFSTAAGRVWAQSFHFQAYRRVRTGVCGQHPTVAELAGFQALVILLVVGVCSATWSSSCSRVWVVARVDRSPLPEPRGAKV